jgi:thymidylate synthase
MNDFICTLGVQYMIRDNKLYSVVNMRSNDIIYGFFNDFYWQATIQERLLNDLIDNGYKDLKMGKMIWVANSLHVYEKHFKKLNNMYEYLKSKRS